MKLFDKKAVERHELKSFTGGQDPGVTTSTGRYTGPVGDSGPDGYEDGDWYPTC